VKLSSLGEFGLIDRLRRRTTPSPLAVRGIGDDCAQHRLPPDEELLTTMDLLLEGVHFRRDWTDLEHLGRKSVAVNVSDIAAMGGTPRFLYLGLGLPATATVEEVDAFAAGALAEAERYGVALAGGDTCRSASGWVIAVTVEGSAPAGQAVGRDGARPGDIVCVSGSLGDSALVLQRLQRNESMSSPLAQRHHAPPARVALGRALAQAGLATAMIDLSDGFAADLGHILEQSGCGAEVELDQLPLSAAFRAAGGTVELAVTGGEDYELLFTLPAARQGELSGLAQRLNLPLTPVGRIVAAPGLQLLAADGRRALPQGGFNHFG